MSDGGWRDWPALAGIGSKSSWRLTAEQAAMRMRPGMAKPDWRGLSPGFGDAARALAEQRYLGDEAAPASSLFWHGDGRRFQAGSMTPSMASSGYGLERRLLDWDNTDGWPPALSALILLDRAQFLPSEAESGTSGAGRDADAPALAALQLRFRDHQVQERIEEGCQSLAGLIGATELAEVYAALLAGNRAVALPAALAGLSGVGCAALLLPLEANVADQLAICTRLPSREVDALRLLRSVESSGRQLLGPSAGGSLSLECEYRPSLKHRDRASAMAEALLSNDPKRLSRVRVPARASGRGGRTLRLWGGPSSGKSAYLGLLATRVAQSDNLSWEVLPGHDIDPGWFADQLRGFVEQCRFPHPTSEGQEQLLNYVLRHRTDGRHARIEFDDRAGIHYAQMSDDMAGQLAAADGILLLLDPLRSDRDVQESEVCKGLGKLRAARGTEAPDPRPLALCGSKCDALIHDLDDYRRALVDPEGFLTPHVGAKLIEAVRRQFPNTRIFALSAAGLRLVPGGVLPAVFYDEAPDLRIRRDGTPINLLEPLVWLLESAIAAE